MLIPFLSPQKLSAITITCVTGFATVAIADEGMWLFNAPPLKQLKEKYNFEPTPQWLDHLQKASVRFNSGGSGSFISANGLVITNTTSAAKRRKKPRTNSTTNFKKAFYAKPTPKETSVPN